MKKKNECSDIAVARAKTAGTALSVLDGDMSQYTSDNTDDEISHETFLNAYLASKGAPMVSLDAPR